MTFLERWRESLGETRPWDFIKPDTELASKELASERYSICLSCPLFISTTKQCSKCGCFMSAKTRLAKAECPEGKWHKV